MTEVLGLLLYLMTGTHDVAKGVEVRIETSSGDIEIRVDIESAPITGCNFLRYVDGGHYDNGRFFRTVHGEDARTGQVPIDVIQLEARGGEEFDGFGPIALERTTQTGLTHRVGALSMARWGPDTATSSFSIVVKPSHEMDFGGKRNTDGQGFAVFGHVTAGMSVVRKMHVSPADKERLREPVRIHRIAVNNRSVNGGTIGQICGT